MASTPNYAQLAIEAKAIHQCTTFNQNELHVPISPIAVIVALRESFRPAGFISKTAPLEMLVELTELLDELGEINDQHIGEKVLEVVAYYSVTGLAQDLGERFRSWADRYATLRAAPGRIGPIVKFDSFLLFEQVHAECETVLAVGRLEQSVGPIFLGPTLEYLPWLLYTLLWRERIAESFGQWTVVGPVAGPAIPGRMAAWLSSCSWTKASLTPFLERLGRCADQSDVARIKRDGADALRQWLTAMAADIQEMRPFLVRNFRPYKTIIELSNNLFVAWAWGHREGIGSLSFGRTAAEARSHVEHWRSFKYMIAVGHDGLLFDWRMPWIKATDLDSLALNCLLLERFHSKLFEFYKKIDIARIHLSCDDHRHDLDAQQEVVAAVCHDLAANDTEQTDDQGPGRGRQLRSLRSERLFRLLASCFGCEVRQGKGSEVVIVRAGRRLFTLGRHKRCQSVNSVTVQSLLKRLGISVAEWRSVIGD